MIGTESLLEQARGAQGDAHKWLAVSQVIQVRTDAAALTRRESTLSSLLPLLSAGAFTQKDITGPRLGVGEK